MGITPISASKLAYMVSEQATRMDGKLTLQVTSAVLH
jgi:hypothetical protein